MSILWYLMRKFYDEEQIYIIVLVILSLISTLISTNYVSVLIADIIQSVQGNKSFTFTGMHNNTAIMTNFYRYATVSVILLVLLYVYKQLQNKVLTKLSQWMKQELLMIILTTNNENIKNVNFVDFVTPINRIPSSCYVLLYDIISVIIPTITLIIGISGYFLYKNIKLGLFFIFMNLALLFYVCYFWEKIIYEKNIFEVKINDNEKIIADILNNVDKVIYRGQVPDEIENFIEKTNEGIDIGMKFMEYSTTHIMILNISVILISLFVIAYILYLRSVNTISTTMFIVLFNVIIMYRERICNLINNITDYLEFIGKLNYISDKFEEMIGDQHDLPTLMNKTYADIDIPFSKIEFRNVSFRYTPKHPYVFQNLSHSISFENKIIGMTGLSGNGKSSFMKLLLRLHDPTGGNIYIDDVDITEINPDYIRENITYINQNSKLFDKKVIDNLLYGCSNTDECEKNLEVIMKYDKIKKLYQNMDIETKMAGSLGENLSGGQRQVVNVVSGLVNHSSILILDEPTNALDRDLKEELLTIIKDFRYLKKCIFIITHDHDVYSLFDETLNI